MSETPQTVTVELEICEARALARAASLVHGLLVLDERDQRACSLTAGAMKLEVALVTAGEVEA